MYSIYLCLDLQSNVCGIVLAAEVTPIHSFIYLLWNDCLKTTYVIYAFAIYQCAAFGLEQK